MRGFLPKVKGIRAYRFLDCSLIKVSGENAYRFFSVCVSMDAMLYDIDLQIQEDYEKDYFLYVKNSDLDILKDASLKTGVNFEIIKEMGIISILKKNYKRKIFFISIAVAVIFLYVMTLFIWQIQISGCETRTEAEIIDVINKTGVYYGILRDKCDCEAIEEAIRNEFEDVLWVSAAIDGTGLFIQIKENTYLNDKMAITDDVADFSSDADGTIVSIVTREGVALVSAGDEVKEGDILISGVKEFYNDAKEVYKTEHVFADGDIIAECVKSYEWKINRNIKVRNYVKKRYGFKIELFNKRIFEYEPDYKDVLYDKQVNNSVLVVGNDLYLPFSFTQTEYGIYTLDDRTLSDKSLTLLAKIKYLMFCENEKSKGVDIIEKNATIEFNDRYCTVKASMITRENIGIHTAIAVQPIEEKTAEELTE